MPLAMSFIAVFSHEDGGCSDGWWQGCSWPDGERTAFTNRARGSQVPMWWLVSKEVMLMKQWWAIYLTVTFRSLIKTPCRCRYENATQQMTWIRNIYLQRKLNVFSFLVVRSLQATSYRQIFVSLINLSQPTSMRLCLITAHICKIQKMLSIKIWSLANTEVTSDRSKCVCLWEFRLKFPLRPR